MFDVIAADTIRLAALQGLRPVLNVCTESVSLENRMAGVSWTRLAFRRLMAVLGQQRTDIFKKEPCQTLLL